MASFKTLRLVAGVSAFVVPVTVTCLDLFGYVAKVEGASMQPSLNPVDQKDEDYVFLNRWKVRDFDIQRGEVVSLIAPNNPDQKIIKRVIALSGDTIKTLSFKNRYVKVPEGHCWIEGDHHGQSMDSNFFGPVALGLITAKASHVVWPPRRWQRLATWSPSNRLGDAPPELPEHLMTFMEDIELEHSRSVSGGRAES